MELTQLQKEILEGKQGETLAKIMKTLMMYGEAFGATRMVEVTSDYNHLVTSFGLGVMNARAAYYAKRDPRFRKFLTEGRTFGPHGEELVVADSILDYNDEISRELTERVVTANLEMRALGFKPFVAPAFSSGALSILLLLRGEWHCGSVYLGGAYMGVKNRYTESGLETEILPLPEKLFGRIRAAEEKLKSII